MAYAPATRPTFYFIGVTTAQSSIMRVFPQWAAHLGLEAVIAGIDFPPRAPAAAYREAVAFLKRDPLSKGALVTTHKLDLFAAARDLFDEIGPHAALMGEVSCLSKRDGRLRAEAKDPVTAGLALEALLPAQHFERTGAAMMVMGAGGSAIAMTWYLMDPARGANRPSRIVITDILAERLDHIRAIHRAVCAEVPVEYVQIATAAENDTLMAGLGDGALVVNATGLGKDKPGSPLTDAATFPRGGVVWELNYRGDLWFLAQARKQAKPRDLTVEDGWTYFIHGWTRVIAEVFDIDIPTGGPGFEAIADIAAQATGRAVA
ncbi:MAG: shikimate dehydrogenase [Paracoccaceae bacterium]|nr:shikimate dehydrogenase [Paracoccaceae bacterium]